MTDQKNGQEYLSFVLEKLQARLAEISQSLLDGQKEIENMHDYYWQNYTEMDQYGYEDYDNQQALLHQVNANQEQLLLRSRFRKMLDSPFFGRVDFCYDGETALELLGVERYDLVLLDLNLPKKDGMTVLRTLRQTDRETRVLILSARSEVEDKVQGLDAGANDYLAKPFHLAELEARIRSLTLRQFTQQDVLLSCGGLTFDTRSRTATVNGQTLTLTRKETGILEYLMVHQGRPVSQEELMDHVWDNSVDSFSNSIRVHISALRKKLRAVLGYDPIRNRIGEGYLMGGEEA